MSDQARGEYLVSDASALALLVDAANAKSQESVRGGGNSVSSSFDSKGYRDSSERSVANQAVANQHILVGDAEWREALQREALQRETLEREAMERELFYRQAALMGYGGLGGFQGIGSQEADYIQQLRLEALLQQRRQEALAQLALAQEMGMGPDMHALFQAQQLRQAALLRQDILTSRSVNPDLLAQMAGVGGGQERSLTEDEQRREETIRKDKYEQQQHLANLSFRGSNDETRTHENLKAVKQFTSPDCTPPVSTDHGVPEFANNIDKQSSQSTQVNPSTDNQSKFTTIPCPVRGMPSDHNDSSAYFKITDDVKHGTNLVCSYYACRNAGAQYRYCATCKTPVSKWSFAKLHKHDGPGISISPKDKLDAQAILTMLVEKGAKEVEYPDIASQQLLSIEKASNEVIIGSQDEKKRIADRQARWDRLLEIRPRNADLMTEWVQQVLATSDFDNDLDTSNGHASIRDQPIDSTVDRINQETSAKITDVKSLEFVEMSKQNTEIACNAAIGSLQDGNSERETSAEKVDVTSKSASLAKTKNPEAENRGQFDDASDDTSTSSEDSVDLRTRKKSKTSN